MFAFPVMGSHVFELHMQPESKKQFFSFTVDAKHTHALLRISSADNNSIIYLQVVTANRGFASLGAGAISCTRSAVALFTEPQQKDDSFYRSQWFISKVLGVWPDNTVWLTMMNRDFARMDTSHLRWRTQTYSPPQCLTQPRAKSGGVSEEVIKRKGRR